MTNGKIAALILAVFAAISLIVVGGCAYLTVHSAEIHKTVSAVLQTAYDNGGAEKVSAKIDALVADGKLSAEQGAKLKESLQKGYDSMQTKLGELSVKDSPAE